MELHHLPHPPVHTRGVYVRENVCVCIRERGRERIYTYICFCFYPYYPSSQFHSFSSSFLLLPPLLSPLFSLPGSSGSFVHKRRRRHCDVGLRRAVCGGRHPHPVPQHHEGVCVRVCMYMCVCVCVCVNPCEHADIHGENEAHSLHTFRHTLTLILTHTLTNTHNFTQTQAQTHPQSSHPQSHLHPRTSAKS